MIILSLFDGMSCGRIALDKIGIVPDKYYASEIDKYAQIVSEKNYPDIIRLGDITNWKEWNIETPDIIMAGSPCQGFSFAGKGLNFNDERSALFFVFIDILKYYKKKNTDILFLLENVIMKKEHNDVISSILGEIFPEHVEQGELFRTGRLEPMEINSALVSAQNRRRLYWFNWNVDQPEDKGILLKDIIEDNLPADKKPDFSYKTQSNSYFDLDEKMQTLSAGTHGYCNGYVKCGAFRGRNPENPKSRESGLNTQQMLEINESGKSNCLTGVQKDNVLCKQIGTADIKGNDCIKRIYSPEGKSPTLPTCQGGNQHPKISTDYKYWRKLTPLECERLQTVPDNYTNCVSNTQRYKMLGNGWTVDIIFHILKGIIKKIKKT